MHIDQQIKLFFARLGEWHVHANPRIIDKEVKIIPLPYLFELLFDRVSKGGKRLCIRYIELQCCSFAASFLDCGDYTFGFCLFTIVSQKDIMSLCGASHRHCFTKSTAAACDNCYCHGYSFQESV